MLIRITIRNNIIAGAIFKILSRSFYAEILALQGFPAGLRDSYFIRDKAGYPEFRDNQPFSIAGSRKGFGDPRGTLFFELARLAEARKPPYLLFENVVGLINHDHCRTFATILNTLDRLGYGVEWQCLNSKDFGVPQSRNRVYIVGYLDERCRGKVFPFTETAGSSLIQTHGGHQGERVYSPEGLSCTLAANPGGFGGKTGLYEVGVPIKCATKTGYQMAQVGDSIDLSYATVNSRRGRVGKEIAHTLTTGCQQGTVEVRPVKNPIKSDLARNTERTGKPGAPMHVKSDNGWTKLDDTTVIMQDAPVLDIDKTDIAGNLLPGATLTIRDAGGEVIDTWVTDYKTHSVPISDDSLKLSDDSKEYIYTLTEDAAPAGFEIANSVQFKLETVDDGISLFVRENVDAEWVRADKRLIQMIDETTPREDTPTPTPAPTPQPTPAAIPVPTPAPTPVIAPRKVQTLPQTGDGFPLLAIVVVSLASATGIVLLTVKQRNALKETSDKEDADESSDR